MNCMGVQPQPPDISNTGSCNSTATDTALFQAHFELYFVYKNFHGYDVREDKNKILFI